MSAEKPQFGISTATFLNYIDFRHAETLIGRPHLREIRETVRATELLDEMGIEVVYRKTTLQQLTSALPSESRILSVHAPIWWDLAQALSHGLQEEKRFSGMIKDIVASAFIFGILKQEFLSANSLATRHQAKTIIHPRGALSLVDSQSLGALSRDSICVEPDSRRLNRKGPWIWEHKKVLDIVKQHGFSVVLDVSHTAIAQNNLDLRTPWELLNDGQNLVKVVHLNAAIPNPEAGIPDPKERGLPITANNKVLNAVIELYQQIQNEGRDDILLVFEYFQRRGQSFEDRVRIIDKSREALVGKPKG